MLSSLLVGAALALAPFVHAQTPPGVTPDIETNLMVTFAGTNVIDPPGERVPRADTANPPTFFVPGNTSVGTTSGLLMMLDLDVPRNDSRATLLHWLANDTVLAPASNGTSVTPPANGGGGAPFRQPNPPAGDEPHRYVFMLFAQPPGFVVPPDFTAVLATRVPFDFMGFIREANLTDPIAANFITVQNTSAATTTFPPPSNPTVTPTSSSSSSGGASASATGASSTGGAGIETTSNAVGAGLDLGKLVGAAMGLVGLFSFMLL